MENVSEITFGRRKGDCRPRCVGVPDLAGSQLIKHHTLYHPPIMPPPTVVSSPGKALIAGGYLVLDPAYSGTVISVSSRFYTVIRDDASVGPNTLRVRSPQFKGATWKFTLKNDSECIVESSSEKCVTLRQLNIRRN